MKYETSTRPKNILPFLEETSNTSFKLTERYREKKGLIRGILYVLESSSFPVKNSGPILNRLFESLQNETTRLNIFKASLNPALNIDNSMARKTFDFLSQDGYFLPLYAWWRGAFTAKTKSFKSSFYIPSWKKKHWKGLCFPNPLGVAAGVDKNGTQCSHWWRLGAGFLELGTVTPKKQKVHPGKILDRNLKHQSLWNHLGFPSVGVAGFKKQLQGLPSQRPPLFINIGKNRETSLENAIHDYAFLVKELSSYADAFVLNISSPNSPQLRQMQKPHRLAPLLKTLRKEGNRPLLLKLSPDFDTSQDFLEVLKVGMAEGVCGFVLTNTTTGSFPSKKKKDVFFQKEYGGYSGKALQPLACRRLQEAVNFLDGIHGFRRKDFLLVSVGGVLTFQDVEQRLSLGADLVQVYSALVFHGPGFFLHMASYFEEKKTHGF